MSDIQAIIELIEEGHRNSDHGDGQKQINEAISALRKMHDDSHLHSGQRWELSQILGCGPLYGDIEKAVRELKEKQGWLPIETLPAVEYGYEAWLFSDKELFPKAVRHNSGENCTEGMYSYGKWYAFYQDVDYEVKPTHWKRKIDPLPVPCKTDHLAEPE